MNDINRIGNMVLHDFKNTIADYGFSIKDEFPVQGQLSIVNKEGRIFLVNLVNLVEYYFTTRDENAVSDFVATIIKNGQPGKPLIWSEDRYNVFMALYPAVAAITPPFARSVTGYCNRFFILDMPEKSVWVTPSMLQEWGVGEVTLERQAHENANVLLNKTTFAIVEREGCPLGSFTGHNSFLNAALLLAPDLKKKVSEVFGWPLYAIIPNKVTCYFFRKKDLKSLEPSVSALVADNYQSQDRITPELLEIGDWDIRTVSNWTKRLGHIFMFDTDTF